MKLYIELYFDSEGGNPLKIIKIMNSLGFEPVLGDFDFAQEYNSQEDYVKLVSNIYNSLKGTKVRYRLTTRKS